MSSSLPLLPDVPERPLHDVSVEPSRDLDLYHGCHETPFGFVVVWQSAAGLRGLSFVQAGGRFPDEAAALEDAHRQNPGARFVAAPEATAGVVETLFARPPGDGTARFRVSLAGTPFQLKVWQALLCLPPGRLVSYQTLARAIGHPKASRAVGSAVGANPVSVLVPCHRVVRGSGTLGGYGWGLPLKRALLAWEGLAPSLFKGEGG
ncbi:methylated-DNA--[protein]-cysteine S-methyltransferase [Pararhodospirillum photometricum]|nr:methylated-DNA--[protein]-cysteine S-methyltransferase [Pararhodospirillum photometricum]